MLFASSRGQGYNNAPDHTPYLKTDTPDGCKCHCSFNNVGGRRGNDNFVSLKIAVTLNDWQALSQASDGVQSL